MFFNNFNCEGIVIGSELAEVVKHGLVLRGNKGFEDGSGGSLDFVDNWANMRPFRGGMGPMDVKGAICGKFTPWPI